MERGAARQRSPRAPLTVDEASSSDNTNNNNQIDGDDVDVDVGDQDGDFAVDEELSLLSSKPSLLHDTKNVRLKGLLKMIFIQQKQQIDDRHRCCTLFDYDLDSLEETHTMYQTKRSNNKRQRRLQSQQQQQISSFSSSSSSSPISISEVINRHRYVAFFVIQYNPNGYYSTHTINLRKKLAMGYHDSMTIFCIFDGMTGGDDDTTGNDSSNNSNSIQMFLQGTGFAHLNPDSISPLVLTLLNITQLPSIVVIDTTTGRSISSSSSSQNYTTLAIQWNDPHTVLNAWQRGNTTGLSWCQIILAILTCQK